MSKHLNHLVEIASIDKEIDSFAPRILKVNEELNAALARRDGVLSQIESLKDDKREVQLKIQKNELHLEDLSAKLEDIAKKNKLIKTEKEMKALSLEEEIAKEQITFANEEIARLEKVKTARDEEIAKLAESIAQIEDEAKAIETGVSERVAQIELERTKIFGAKEQLIEKMDQKIIIFYEKIRKWAKNSTVVPVKKQACGGCFLKLNDKIYADVIRGDDIITCPHCGRILFIQSA